MDVLYKSIQTLHMHMFYMFCDDDLNLLEWKLRCNHILQKEDDNTTELREDVNDFFTVG